MEEEEKEMSFSVSIFVLGVLTIVIAVMSEFIVNAIEEASEDIGLSQIFIGAVILPIVGNAAEHATAVTVAYKNKMDLSLGVAVGSSTQVI